MEKHVYVADGGGEKIWEDCSIALFAHWGGEDFQKLVDRFYKEFYGNMKESECMPIDRREPSNVVLNFIYWLRTIGEIEYPVRSSYYLGKDFHDGDCSDNGCYDFDAKTGKLIRIMKDSYKDDKWHVIEGENIEHWSHRYDEDSPEEKLYGYGSGFLESLPEVKPNH